MLPKNSFLRNMPRAMDLSERLRIEAVITSVDIIDAAFVQLVKILEGAVQTDLVEFEETERIQTTLNCWTIVDHLHNFLQFMRKQPKIPGGPLEKFINEFGIATKMRNSMDHVSSNLKNLASIKGPVPPLHGTISYSLPPRDEEYFEYVLLPLGAIHHENQVSSVIDTRQPISRDGIANIAFAAFGHQLDVSRAITELHNIILVFDKNYSAHMLSEIDRMSVEEGFDAAEVKENTVSGTAKFRLRIKRTRDD